MVVLDSIPWYRVYLPSEPGIRRPERGHLELGHSVGPGRNLELGRDLELGRNLEPGRNLELRQKTGPDWTEDATTMKIGEVAGAAGVNVQTVRYYERRGLLKAPPRTASGYRTYDPVAVARIRFIQRAQELGFTLSEVEELMALRVTDPEQCEATEARARRKLTEVRRKVAELRRMEGILTELLASCRSRSPTEECPILRTLGDHESILGKGD
jgi:Hg(II)-responsive transcriptional regulator